ncbi:MAG TPA: hypothetical protein VFQ11_16080 [Nocardioidaceae bacterium]|jgi:hypothetical protein|nr:hypothetical protein [Nocardioidaceae bacterium]
MTDQFDVSLHDDELLAEIRLATELMIAASRRDGGLTPAEVDEVLAGDHGDPWDPQRG